MNASDAGDDLALIKTSLLCHLNTNKLVSKHLGLLNRSSDIQCISFRCLIRLLGISSHWDN